MEIGVKGRIANYVLLGTVVVLADAAIASDKIIILIGIIGLVVCTGITSIANLKDVMHSPLFLCQTSVNRFEKEEVILALSSPKSALIENIFAIEENRINLLQSITFNSAHA